METHPTALIVDDERQIRWILATALSKERFACEVADSGSDALRMAALRQYDLVITDLSMAKGDGQMLATELLKLQRRPLIVVHTGVMEPSIAKDLIERGVDDIVFKPANFAALAAKMRALVDRRSTTQPPPEQVSAF